MTIHHFCSPLNCIVKFSTLINEASVTMWVSTLNQCMMHHVLSLPWWLEIPSDKDYIPLSKNDSLYISCKNKLGCFLFVFPKWYWEALTWPLWWFFIKQASVGGPEDAVLLRGHGPHLSMVGGHEAPQGLSLAKSSCGAWDQNWQSHARCALTHVVSLWPWNRLC